MIITGHVMLCVLAFVVCGLLMMKKLKDRKRGTKMEDMEEMSLEELLEMLKSGHVGNINKYYMGMFIKYLEELEALRVELEKNSKELKLYKKALILMHTQEVCSNCNYYDDECKGDEVERCIDYYLQKARE